MKPVEKIERLIKKSRYKASPEVYDRALDNFLQAVDSYKKQKSALTEPNIWRTVRKNPFAKLAAAAVIIIAIIIGIHQFGGSIESLAWASVAERFRSAPFFNATIYFKEDATAQPEQVELWMNREGFARLRYDNQVVFSKEGKVTKAFDLDTRSEIEPDQRVVTLVHLMGDAESFSLETVLRGISGGELVDVTPLVNTDAVISEDLVVFDIEHEKYPQWFRIWALRESKLPVRIRMWDPRDGECADVLLTYSKQQQEIFFDPEEFSSKMKNLSNKKINLAYMFLKDPGGKQIFPGSLNESEAFSVVTQTIDGQPWSLADHRGKVVLINFWERREHNRWESWLKEIYERFGDRDDFIMVGVSLHKNADSAKNTCKKMGIEWLQLHEPGKGYNNSLARAFGIDSTYGGWLVWRNGRIDRLNYGPSPNTEIVEGAVLGLTYNSHIWICKILKERAKRRPLTFQDFEELCGSSYTVDLTPIGRKRRNYRRYNKDKTHVRTIHVEVNKDGTMGGWGCGSWLVDPAEVTISFSSEYLKKHVESQVESEIYEKMYKDYQVMISAETGGRGFPFAGNSIKPGETYSRQLPPGTYDFVINIGPANDFGTITKKIKSIILLKQIHLNRNEGKTFRFE